MNVGIVDVFAKLEQIFILKTLRTAVVASGKGPGLVVIQRMCGRLSAKAVDGGGDKMGNVLNTFGWLHAAGTDLGPARGVANFAKV